MSHPASDDGPNRGSSDRTTAVVWTVLALGVAIFMFWYADRVEPEKRNFYLIGAAIAAIITVMNGWSAYSLFQKSKSPPKS
ncbi:MAG: hypothetical protein RMJ56_02385 [Gemmataceae bacterium]|nr:hypothetical protein [Gemmataceae bacterium]